ncbi:hypothetical protein BD779DRAFT_1133132 [Infundibulicybe gibba]|nr:hypothetical protein BD779DRAFT_1133132 [Infundibulicybe gibba]
MISAKYATARMKTKTDRYNHPALGKDDVCGRLMVVSGGSVKSDSDPFPLGFSHHHEHSWPHATTPDSKFSQEPKNFIYEWRIIGVSNSQAFSFNVSIKRSILKRQVQPTSVWVNQTLKVKIDMQWHLVVNLRRTNGLIKYGPRSAPTGSTPDMTLICITIWRM